MLSEESCDNTEKCADENSCDYSADSDTSWTMEGNQTCENGNYNHGAVKPDFNFENAMPVIWETACIAPSPARGIRFGGR